MYIYIYIRKAVEEANLEVDYKIKTGEGSFISQPLRTGKYDICRCLPPDKTWHKVKSPKAD